MTTIKPFGFYTKETVKGRVNTSYNDWGVNAARQMGNPIKKAVKPEGVGEKLDVSEGEIPEQE